MKKILTVLILLFAGIAWTTTALSFEFTEGDAEHFQHPITVTLAPERPLSGRWSLKFHVDNNGLSDFQPIVPSYNDKGSLLASWNPHPLGVAGRPTFVVLHGGHGVGPTNLATARWLRDDVGANVLVLDSFWSRGLKENWLTTTKFGAHMRMLDSVATARWLRTQPGIDTNQFYLMGDSQGGWAVLNTFTDGAWQRQNVTGLYRGGISLYPVCNSRGWREDPTLGPYLIPVAVFTGGNDWATPPGSCPSKVFKTAAVWQHYPRATHAFDKTTHGGWLLAQDGHCSRAGNIYLQFEMCRDNKSTEDMQAKIKKFIQDLAAK